MPAYIWKLNKMKADIFFLVLGVCGDFMFFLCWRMVLNLPRKGILFYVSYQCLSWLIFHPVSDLKYDVLSWVTWPENIKSLNYNSIFFWEGIKMLPRMKEVISGLTFFHSVKCWTWSPFLFIAKWICVLLQYGRDKLNIRTFKWKQWKYYVISPDL